MQTNFDFSNPTYHPPSNSSSKLLFESCCTTSGGFCSELSIGSVNTSHKSQSEGINNEFGAQNLSYQNSFLQQFSASKSIEDSSDPLLAQNNNFNRATVENNQNPTFGEQLISPDSLKRVTTFVASIIAQTSTFTPVKPLPPNNMQSHDSAENQYAPLCCDVCVRAGIYPVAQQYCKNGYPDTAMSHSYAPQPSVNDAIHYAKAMNYFRKEIQAPLENALVYLQRVLRLRTVEIVTGALLFEKFCKMHWRCATFVLFRSILKTVFIVCIMIAHKTSADECINNKHWAATVNIRLEVLNEYEKDIWAMLNHDVSVDTSRYSDFIGTVVSPSTYPSQIAFSQYTSDGLLSSSSSSSVLSSISSSSTINSGSNLNVEGNKQNSLSPVKGLAHSPESPFTVPTAVTPTSGTFTLSPSPSDYYTTSPSPSPSVNTFGSFVGLPLPQSPSMASQQNDLNFGLGEVPKSVMNTLDNWLIPKTSSFASCVSNSRRLSHYPDGGRTSSSKPTFSMQASMASSASDDAQSSRNNCVRTQQIPSYSTIPLSNSSPSVTYEITYAESNNQNMVKPCYISA